MCPKSDDLKKSNRLLLTTILISVLIIALAYVPQAGSRPNTTIKVDGDDGDWVGIDPIVVDKKGDEDEDYDLLECYVTNDASNLYFMIKVSGKILYAEWESGEWDDFSPPYAVGLDTDQNPETGIRGEQPGLDIGVDYILAGPLHGSNGPYTYFFVIIKTPSELTEYWEPELIGSFSSSFSEDVLEFYCPLSTIGRPDAIDILFAGKPFGTDFAPDQTDDEFDYVTYEVYISSPPTRRQPYVGGEFYSANKLVILAPYLALIGLASMVVLAFKRRKR